MPNYLKLLCLVTCFSAYFYELVIKLFLQFIQVCLLGIFSPHNVKFLIRFAAGKSVFFLLKAISWNLEANPKGLLLIKDIFPWLHNLQMTWLCLFQQVLFRIQHVNQFCCRVSQNWVQVLRLHHVILRYDLWIL